MKDKREIIKENIFLSSHVTQEKYRYLLRLNSDKSHTVFQRHYDKMQTQTIMTLQEIIKENTVSTNRKGEDW